MAKGIGKQKPSLPRASDERWMVIRMGSDELEELLTDLRGMIRGSRGRLTKRWVSNVSRAAVIRAVLERREKIAPNVEPGDGRSFDEAVIEEAPPEESGPPTLTKYTTFIDLCLLGLCRIDDVDGWVRAWNTGEPAVMSEEPLNFSLGLFADEMEAWESGTLSLRAILAKRKEEALARGASMNAVQQKPEPNGTN
ncbi:hypothetical protein ACFQY5_40015 [Paeniroseomonas aquatica]|uniref:Tail assembly chaperone n=1 Tax=Paeniroseomonas aquatica TaxID=373043 RepID=A0ABT8A061_9PROT|nr:hypothetical protein [Paeniroseomonas aquatica]MDN3563110.1 hypothetical protein [Paeniroseomonas aquatica]